mgnify:FL=1
MNLKDAFRNTFGFLSIHDGRVDWLRLSLIDIGIPLAAILYILISQNHAANYLVLATAILGRFTMNTYLDRLE